MLRDLEAGGRTEAEHILGFLLDAARRVCEAEEIHAAALLRARMRGGARPAACRGAERAPAHAHAWFGSACDVRPCTRSKTPAARAM